MDGCIMYSEFYRYLSNNISFRLRQLAENNLLVQNNEEVHKQLKTWRILLRYHGNKNVCNFRKLDAVIN